MTTTKKATPRWWMASKTGGQWEWAIAAEIDGRLEILRSTRKWDDEAAARADLLAEVARLQGGKS